MADQKSIDVLFEQFAKMKVELQTLRQDNQTLNLKIQALEKEIKSIREIITPTREEVYEQLRAGRR